MGRSACLRCRSACGNLVDNLQMHLYSCRRNGGAGRGPALSPALSLFTYFLLTFQFSTAFKYSADRFISRRLFPFLLVQLPGTVFLILHGKTNAESMMAGLCSEQQPVAFTCSSSLSSVKVGDFFHKLHTARLGCPPRTMQEHCRVKENWYRASQVVSAPTKICTIIPREIVMWDNKGWIVYDNA